jgi:hypothetical protein
MSITATGKNQRAFEIKRYILYFLAPSRRIIAVPPQEFYDIASAREGLLPATQSAPGH